MRKYLWLVETDNDVFNTWKFPICAQILVTTRNNVNFIKKISSANARSTIFRYEK